MTKTVTSDTLNAAVEFDAPFHVHDDHRTITDHTGLYAPDIELDNTAGGDVHVWDTDWTPLTGHTGQYGYDGAVMHPSETLSGGLADRVLSEPGTYVVTEVRNEDGTLPDGDAIGWAILRYTGDDK